MLRRYNSFFSSDNCVENIFMVSNGKADFSLNCNWDCIDHDYSKKIFGLVQMYTFQYVSQSEFPVILNLMNQKIQLLNFYSIHNHTLCRLLNFDRKQRKLLFSFYYVESYDWHSSDKMISYCNQKDHVSLSIIWLADHYGAVAQIF